MRKVIDIFFLMVAFLLIGCAASIEEEELAGRLETPNGNAIIGRWPIASILTRMSAQFDQTERDAFKAMGALWNDTANGQFEFLNVDTGSVLPDRNSYSLSDYKTDSEFGIYKRESWFDEIGSSSIAVTQYIVEQRVEGGFPTILHADIIVNYDDFKFAFVDDQRQITYAGSSPFDAPENADKKGPYDLPSVILHELGHFLGLDHINANNRIAVMASTISSLLKKQDLQDIEIETLLQLYGLNFTPSQSPRESNAISLFNLQAMTTTSRTNRGMPVGTRIEGLIELREDGSCLHYQNGELVYTHETKLAPLSRTPNILK